MRRVIVGIVIAATCAASCATHHRAATPSQKSGPPPATVFVTGDGVTAGDGLDDALHAAWPRLVFREAFPLGSVLVNGASRNATVDNAIATQLPIAADAHPDTALVWLGAREAATGASPGAVEQSFRSLFTGLRSDGAKRIIAAGVPGLGSANASAYNSAIERAADAAGVRFVDLSNVRLSANSTGTIVATPAQHREVADAFVRALRQP